MPSSTDLVKLLGYQAVKGGLEAELERWTTDAKWRIGTHVKYAVFVHEGTARMAGRPYLTDAIDVVVRRYGSEIADDADSADEIAERIAELLQEETVNKIEEYGAVDTGNLRDSIAVVRVN